MVLANLKMNERKLLHMTVGKRKIEGLTIASQRRKALNRVNFILLIIYKGALLGTSTYHTLAERVLGFFIALI